MFMATDTGKRSTEHPIDRPPDTDPQQGHEHPEADPRAPHSQQGRDSDSTTGADSGGALPLEDGHSQGR